MGQTVLTVLTQKSLAVISGTGYATRARCSPNFAASLNPKKRCRMLFCRSSLRACRTCSLSQHRRTLPKIAIEAIKLFLQGLLFAPFRPAIVAGLFFTMKIATAACRRKTRSR
jgi:hypothetical protein